MGVCSSQTLTPEELKARREAKIRSKWIEELQSDDVKGDEAVIKLLFLGAGESGKSTLLKQMMLIHGAGFSPDDRQNYRGLVHANIIQAMKMLVKQFHDFPKRYPELAQELGKTWDWDTEEERKAAQKLSDEVKYDDELTPDLAKHVRTLWDSSIVKFLHECRSKFQLLDSAKYFFDQVEVCAASTYMPTDPDILHARIRTTGIVEHRFIIKENDFRMIDVGGQRNARKKWIHCFENVTAIIFVAAVSEYDQVLFEDPTTNRLHEALNLFQDICASKFFERTSFILFLNKKDLFKEKIRKVPLSVCFGDYAGPNEYRAGLKFMKEQFKAQNSVPNRKIFTHFTCATDTSNIKRVFHYVQNIIIRAHLVDVGLLDPETIAPGPFKTEQDLGMEDGSDGENDME